MMRILTFFIVLLGLATAPASLALAEDRSLDIELNRVQTVASGCRVSFLARNAVGVELEAVNFEIVLFDTKQLVDAIMVIEFGRLPVAKTRVIQFDLKGKACEGVSRLIINEVQSCKGQGMTEALCLDLLKLNNRTSINFGL